MRLRLLGTGAADGWPNPFCRCEACYWAMATGTVRGQTSALIDEAVVIDCGPQTTYQAVRLRESLIGVRAILFTHAHSDHFAPETLLYRSWVNPEPLQIIGPKPVIEAVKPWLAPDSPVALRPVAAGDDIEVRDYRVRVLPANHRVYDEADSVLFDIQGRNHARMLWASDTGPLPESWFAQVRDARYDVVCLEQTFGERALSPYHHDAVSFAQTVAQLREYGAVETDTKIVAVHLGHHNHDESVLSERLSSSGATAGVDGQIITMGVSSPQL